MARLLPYPPGVRAPAASELVPVLLYHDVTASPRDPYAVTHATFATHMRAVAGSGRVALTVNEYVAGLRGRAALPDRPVLVTFDDGYREFPRAVEAMASAGVEAGTLYVTTAQADTDGMVSWRDLAAMPDRIQIGAHSRTHPQLDVLPSAELNAEVRGSKTDVEQRLGRTCTSFAYPHGHHGARVKRAVVAAGFDSAAGVKNALSHRHDDPYAVARVTVTAQTTDADLAALLEGRGAPVAWRRERLRTKAFRAYRRYAPGGRAHV
jgi:peptidoglycan/xylan/chitin deacetylase (PgdA/CDA1 family)